MILNTLRTTLISSVSSLSTLKPLFNGDQRYCVSILPLYATAHFPCLPCRIICWDQISGSEIIGAGTCVCGSSFAMTRWYSTIPGGISIIWPSKAETWRKPGWTVWLFTHIFCSCFAMVCFLGPLHYWFLEWFLLLQRWEVESHRGRRDFSRPATQGPLRMRVALLFLSQGAPWLS